MPPTIRDVAKRLNLSITTVSRALDGYDDVAVDTRDWSSKQHRKWGTFRTGQPGSCGASGRIH